MNKILKYIVNKLRNGNRKVVKNTYTLDDFDMERFMKTVENAAWAGSDKQLAELRGIDGDAVLIFKGRIYEPVYEFFEPTCDVFVKFNERIEELYCQKAISIAPYRHEVKETGNREDIIEFIKKHFNNGFTIHYPFEKSV